ncbi:MAG: hypothetical protein U0271_22515 [Polyangiaceae bacterium]
MRTLRLAAVLGVLGLVACSSPKSPNGWQTGGARLDLPGAQWTYKNKPVVIRTHMDWAEVMVDGDVVMVLDRVGRIYDRYQRPLGMLEPDGRVVGLNEEQLGIVGSAYAALPGRPNAWLGLDAQGQLTRFSPEGAPMPAGQWIGCGYTPFTQQACLLVSYLFYYDDEGKAALNAPQGPMPGMVAPR